MWVYRFNQDLESQSRYNAIGESKGKLNLTSDELCGRIEWRPRFRYGNCLCKQVEVEPGILRSSTAN